uniref:mutS protein homolog 4 n=1 Tax=Myxine glutinosa TaxID=7769 RepID=UPI00358F0C53
MEAGVWYYCLAAAGALITYMECDRNIKYAPGSLRIVFKATDNTVMIDSFTARNLELHVNARDCRNKLCLFGMLNHTKTAAGERLLRASILEPLLDLNKINERLGAVGELRKERDLDSLQALISQFLDIDGLVSALIMIPTTETMQTIEAKLMNTISLKHILQLTGQLQLALQYFQTPLLQAYSNSLKDERFTKMLESINMVINEDTHLKTGHLSMKVEKFYVVKASIDGTLDIARRAYNESIRDIQDLVKMLCDFYNLPIQLIYTPSKGFQLKIKSALLQEKLPQEFVITSVCESSCTFTSLQLQKLNTRCEESAEEIFFKSNVVISKLLAEVHTHIYCLHKLSDALSMLDLLISFAYSTKDSPHVCPEFTDIIYIKQGRHPFLEHKNTKALVPNDVFAAPGAEFVLITGPNMSGKSTYIKQVALLQIMAQIGSFVPAEIACFPLVDQIFTRSSVDDEIEMNMSTFTQEMKEASYLMANATDRSLIIIDELCHSTSPREGLAFIQATCEHLLRKKAFTFFATHFLELQCLGIQCSNITYQHFEVKHEADTAHKGDHVIFTYMLRHGISPEEHYDLCASTLAHLPSIIIENSQKISMQLKHKRKMQQLSPETQLKNSKRKLARQLQEAARRSWSSAQSLKLFLKQVKQQYLEAVKSIKSTASL